MNVPKAGVGNTNDGNTTSRRFFADPDTSSWNSGINMVEVISNGFTINAEKFTIP